MLSPITLLFIAFMNLFMIPVIGLRVYCLRRNTALAFSSNVVYLYTLITILNTLLTHVFLKVIEVLFSVTIYLETTKYTVIALISCLLLPFLMEIFETCFHVQLKISPKGKNIAQRATKDEEKN